MTMRVHNRTDLEYIIVRGVPRFCRRAYACVITQATAYPDERAIYHVETFYGQDGRKVRAEAMRFGSDITHGRRGIVGYRVQYVPHNFYRAGLPKPENEIAIR